MSSRKRLLRALPLGLALGLLAGVVGPAGPATASAPPTTTNPVQDLLKKILQGGTTTVPPPPATTGQPSPTASPGTPGRPATGPTTTTTVPRVVPPDAQRLINSIRRTGGRTTDPLMTALRQLVDIGLSPQEAAVQGMGHFPVGGEAAYNDDFLMPRFTGTFHLHQGNDIFAARGTPVRAPNDGIVRFGADTLGGNAVYLTLPDGTFYYGAHLDSYAKIPSGSKVSQGQIIGYVGDTGDAAGSPHLHFEIHPKGGAAVNPKPILDKWLDDAIDNVANILASYQVGVPRAIVDAGVLRRFDEPVADGPGPVLLAASSAGGGSLRLTELRATRSLNDRAKAEAAALDSWKAAEQTAKSVLAPITPRMLQAVLAPSRS